ncbi:DUF29 domain-containing protein [Testudinibacter sp. P27/CKL/0425]
MSIAYDKDFYGWTNAQAQLLKAGAFGQLDVANLIEEIESMGRSELSELRNRLKIIIIHLLKWEFQPSHRGRSWELTIVEQRGELQSLLDDSPSLKHKLNQPEFLQKAWKLGVIGAAKETGFPLTSFPHSPIWTLDEILDDNFLP